MTAARGTKPLEDERVKVQYLIDFAYQEGYHEMGYDPLAEFEKLVRADERQKAFSDVARWLELGDLDTDRRAAEEIRSEINDPGGPGDGSGRRVE